MKNGCNDCGERVDTGDMMYVGGYSICPDCFREAWDAALRKKEEIWSRHH